MGFKKIKGIDSEEIFETKVTDGTGRLISKWKVLKDDFPAVIRILDEQFGLNLRKKGIETNKDKDLEWAMK